MTRHGYVDDGFDDADDVLRYGRWRAQVQSAVNDDWCSNCTPEQRWKHMREWVEKRIAKEKP